MKIKLKKDALIVHASTMPEDIERYDFEKAYRDLLSRLQGKWLDVDTSQVYADQIDVVIIPGLPEHNVRIAANLVEEVQDDIRPGLARCSFCRRLSTQFDRCSNCNVSGCLYVFNDKPGIVFR